MGVVRNETNNEKRGEPTLNPDFIPLIEHLKSKQQWVMLVTNASQGPSYWNKHSLLFDVLIFSIHFEFADLELLKKNIK